MNVKIRLLIVTVIVFVLVALLCSRAHSDDRAAQLATPWVTFNMEPLFVLTMHGGFYKTEVVFHDLLVCTYQMAYGDGVGMSIAELDGSWSGKLY